ncbi:MAG: DUF354 domain-containing protein [Bacteroidia bacterium]
MTLLVYLGHPAHFHLFKETIKDLQSKNVKVVVVIKSKDVLEKLLIDSKLDYLNISDANNKGNAYKNFAKRLFNLAKIIGTYKPNLMVGSAAELTVLGKLFRIPAYVFFEDDFEAVKKFAKIAGPLATKLICPDCCSAWKWDYKKVGYKSYHELAYLHPNHFTPDAEKVKYIFNLNEKNFILRFAQLTAYHDVGKSGITTNIAQQLIDMLSAHGNIFITSERVLEPQFEKYRIQISPLDIHHALYFADMYIGDSQTMTAEAAVLGTPAIRFNDFVGELSYLEELEHTFHLTYGIKTNHPEQLLQKVKELLQTSDLKKEWQNRRSTMLAERIDFAEFMTALIHSSLK